MKSPSFPTFTIQDNPNLPNFSEIWRKISFASFKNVYANLARNLVSRLPSVSNKFNLDSVFAYYKRKACFSGKYRKTTAYFFTNSEDEVLKVLKDNNPAKAAGIDNLFGRFLKDGELF